VLYQLLFTAAYNQVLQQLLFTAAQNQVLHQLLFFSWQLLIINRYTSCYWQLKATYYQVLHLLLLIAVIWTADSCCCRLLKELLRSVNSSRALLTIPARSLCQQLTYSFNHHWLQLFWASDSCYWCQLRTVVQLFVTAVV
jgi:hypothetical protein